MCCGNFQFFLYQELPCIVLKCICIDVLDIDECTTGDNSCHEEASCTNTVGSYDCRCRLGYRGDGRQCFDVDECGENRDECDENARCENTAGSYNCICNQGYRVSCMNNTHSVTKMFQSTQQI